jgi:hypothetical protein
MQSVAFPTKEAIVVQQRGPKGAMLAMRFNHDGKYYLKIGTN